VKRSFKGNARFLVVQKSRPDTFELLDYLECEWPQGHGLIRRQIGKDRKKASIVVVKPEHPTPQ
jgi:hypothetical protein